MMTRIAIPLLLVCSFAASYVVAQGASTPTPGSVQAPLVAVRPYDLHDVTFASEDAILAGTLYLPYRQGRHPALVLTHGSGEEGRTGQYRALAQYFGRRGIAVLIYDKRGTGESTGEYQETPDTADYYARDVLAAVAMLKSHEQINAEQIGVWGHSQGGWIGPVAATQSDDIAFVINVSGPGVSPFEQIMFHRMQDSLREGMSEADARAKATLRRARWRYYRTGEGYDKAAKLNSSAVATDWFNATGWDDPLVLVEDVDPESLSFIRKPFLDYDPAMEVYEEIRQPVLVIYGDLDWQIPVPASIKAIEEARKKNPHADIVVKVFEGTGHGIMTRGEGRLLYFMPGYPELMLEWMKQRLTINTEWPAR